MAGYADIDQLGMCYPEPVSDPGRHRMKAQNLGAVVANYRAAGAQCVVVSGVVDPGRGLHAGLAPLAAFTLCRLRAGRDELKRRFLSRGGQAGLLEEVLSGAGAMDASDFADACADTSGLRVAEAARLVRERLAGWPILTGRAAQMKPAGRRPAGAAADAEALEHTVTCALRIDTDRLSVAAAADAIAARTGWPGPAG